jgi:hypothetical protein
VLIVSSDLSELILLCHRISVVVDGRVIATLRRDEFRSREPAVTGILPTHPIRSSRRMFPPPIRPIGDWRRGSGGGVIAAQRPSGKVMGFKAAVDL